MILTDINLVAKCGCMCMILFKLCYVNQLSIPQGSLSTILVEEEYALSHMW